ncbi:hypothetical protein HMPREF0322_03813 [Desulfitobacterium hafniense DP7]|uniref:Uncharacterized protein n=1 Tax=Desulfitobacterium hafniense DP7 TaxID=537010 RepID=G9XS64_DESHA|nr:hypothetical protein HMPREF0322_03813 [Desulfitobacterium hafniense DP7]
MTLEPEDLPEKAFCHGFCAADSLIFCKQIRAAVINEVIDNCSPYCFMSVWRKSKRMLIVLANAVRYP